MPGFNIDRPHHYVKQGLWDSLELDGQLRLPDTLTGWLMTPGKERPFA